MSYIFGYYPDTHVTDDSGFMWTSTGAPQPTQAGIEEYLNDPANTSMLRQIERFGPGTIVVTRDRKRQGDFAASVNLNRLRVFRVSVQTVSRVTVKVGA